MEEEVPKKHYARTILITLISVVIVVIVGVIVYIWQVTGAPPLEIVNSFLGNSGSSNASTNNNPPSDNVNQDNPSAGSSGGSGGGGSGGGGGSSGSSPICYPMKVSYSIEKIVKKLTCLQQSDSDCLEQEINCTAEIHNFDDEIAGDFDVKIDFIDRTQGEEPVNSKTDSFTIEPLNFSVMQEIYSTQGQNPDLDCVFSTLSAPSKEVCY